MIDMIETLAEIDLPRRWTPPEASSLAMQQWPLLAALMKGETDEFTQGVIMGLKGVLEYLQLATDLDPKDLPLPTEETLEQVMKSKEKLIPDLVDQFGALANRQKESKTAFTKGLLVGFACWFLCVKDIGDESEELENVEALYEQPAYPVAEEDVSEAYKGAVESLVDSPKLKKVVTPSKVRDLIVKLHSTFGVDCEILFRNESFVLVAKIHQSMLCHDLLKDLETAFEADGSDLSYVVSDGMITAAVKIPENMEW